MPNLYSFIRNIPLPDPPYSTALTFVPIAIIPFALGALEDRAGAFAFEPTAQFYGLQLIRSLQVALLTGNDSIDRLYRLLDANLSGTTYIATETDGNTTITPAIPVVPGAVSRSIHSRLERLEYLLDNGINGAVHLPDFADPNGIKQKLDAVVSAIQATGQLDDDSLNELIQIAALLA